MRKLNLFVILAVISLGVFFALPSKAALVGNTNQAVLTASPQTGTYNANDNFQVSIYVNTGSKSVVVVAAYLNYDKAKFQAVSVDTTGSVFTMEAEKIIDSTNGVVKITRGIPSPGVNTPNGLVATINFKAITATSPASDNLTFQFTAGSVLESNVILNDGLGTDYLGGVYNGRYTVGGESSSVSPFCGDGSCNGSETCSSCSSDCGCGSPSCTSFTYSAWSTCQSNNIQTRTVFSSSPSGCAGGNPILSQSCVYTPSPEQQLLIEQLREQIRQIQLKIIQLLALLINILQQKLNA